MLSILLLTKLYQDYIYSAGLNSDHPLHDVIEGMLHPDPEERVTMEKVASVLQKTVRYI